MIPALIGITAVVAGVEFLSGNDDKKKTYSEMRTVSEDYVKQKMARSGRPIKIAGGSQALKNTESQASKNTESPLLRVMQIIAEELDLDENSIQLTDRFSEDLGATYYQKCLILDLIGKEFNVNFFGKEIRTVGDIFNYIHYQALKNTESQALKNTESPLSRIMYIIAEELDLDEDSIQLTDRFSEDLGATYYQKCLILDLIGKEFNVNFSGKEIRTVGNIFNYIH